MPKTNLDPITGLLIYDGDVSPAELLDDLDHGAHLVQIRGDGAREVFEARLV